MYINKYIYIIKQIYLKENNFKYNESIVKIISEISFHVPIIYMLCSLICNINYDIN